MFPPSVFLFFGFAIIILVTFSLWRIGKEEIDFSGWGATGLIILSVCTEAGISLMSRFLSKNFCLINYQWPIWINQILRIGDFFKV